MHQQRFLLALATLSWVASSTPSQSFAQESTVREPVSRLHVACASGDDDWFDGFKLPILNGPIRTVLPDGDALIVGGSFNQAARATASYIARWDGAEWSTVAEGLPGPVWALAFWNGHLVAAGENYVAKDAPRVFKLVGSQWVPLGTMNGTVRALAVFDGQLVAAGFFTHAQGESVTNVAQWDGDSWEKLGPGLVGDVRILLPHAGKLVAAGGIIPSYDDIAQWDGTSWSGLGDGFQGDNRRVFGLASDGVKLYASGYMDFSGAHAFTGLPQWDGVSWSSLGSTSAPRRARSLAMHQGALVAGTDPPQVWNGSSWTTPASNWSTHFAEEPELLVSWDGTLLGLLGDLAAYDGTTWSALEEAWAPGSAGLVTGANSATVWNGALVATSGRYAGAEDHFEVTTGFASWDGDSWSSVGAPFSSWGLPYAVTTWNGDLYAGGLRILGDTQPTRYVARWDGTAWMAVGQGLSGYVRAFATYQTDLIALGIFGSAIGGPVLNGVGRWNGATWSPLGTGIPTNHSSGILPRAGVQLGDDLFVTGRFSSAGGVPVSNVARWDGAAWHALDSGLDDVGLTVVSYGGEVVVGGRFTFAGNVHAPGVARWNGVSWSPMGEGAVAIEALEVIDGVLFAAGVFRCDDASLIHALALWDGAGWRLLSPGFNTDGQYSTDVLAEPIFQDVVGHDGEVWVLGHFTAVGDVPSFRVARWTGWQTTVDVPRATAGAGLALASGPNPSRGPVTLRLSLPRASHVRLAVHDLAGREIAVLANARFGSGAHVLSWDGRGADGARRAPGVYWACLTTPYGVRSTRLVGLD